MRTKLQVLSSYLIVVVVALTLLLVAQPGRGQYVHQLPVGGAQYVFQPPAGWNRVQATTLGLGLWLHPGDAGFSQNISARADHFSGTLADLTQQTVTRVRSQHPDAKLGSIQRTEVCNGHPAAYLSYAAAVKGYYLYYEQMLTLYGDVAYAATYTRAADQPSIPEARRALTTLCGGHPPVTATATAAPTGQHPLATGTPLPVTNINTPQPQQTYGYPVATITPRTGP